MKHIKFIIKFIKYMILPCKKHFVTILIALDWFSITIKKKT